MDGTVRGGANLGLLTSREVTGGRECSDSFGEVGDVLAELGGRALEGQRRCLLLHVPAFLPCFLRLLRRRRLQPATADRARRGDAAAERRVLGGRPDPAIGRSGLRIGEERERAGMK